jgi:predicted esterase
MVQTTIDYRRAIDYLETREEIDTSQIGAFGTSVGANMILVLSTVDERVKSIVVCSTLMDGLPEPIMVFDPIHFSPANKDATVLLQVGKTDGFSPTKKVEMIYEGLNVKSKDLIYYEFGHEPTDKYVKEAVAWFINNKL